jgi:hypothetical protein
MCANGPRVWVVAECEIHFDRKTKPKMRGTVLYNQHNTRHCSYTLLCKVLLYHFI